MTQYKLPPDWQTSGEWDHHLGIGGDVEVVESFYQPNPNPVFTPELLPGFTFESSRVVDSQIVYEDWLKGPDTVLKLTLKILKDQEECLSRALEHFPVAPTPGSFSGEPVGDHCWSNTAPAGYPYSSSVMVVITGNNVFSLGLSSCIDPNLPDSLTESLARALVERLKTWQLSV